MVCKLQKSSALSWKAQQYSPFLKQRNNITTNMNSLRYLHCSKLLCLISPYHGREYLLPLVLPKMIYLSVPDIGGSGDSHNWGDSLVTTDF